LAAFDYVVVCVTYVAVAVLYSNLDDLLSDIVWPGRKLVLAAGPCRAEVRGIGNIRLPDSKAEDWDRVTGVHLQRAVDGELRRAAQVGAEG